MTNHDSAPITHAGSSPSGLKAHPKRAFKRSAFKLPASISTPYVAVIAAKVTPSRVTLSLYRLQSILVRFGCIAAAQHRAPDSSSGDAALGSHALLVFARSPAFRPLRFRSGLRAPWRCPSQPLAAPERKKGLTVQGGERGQDKGRQCAKPMRPGCGLDFQGFRDAIVS